MADYTQANRIIKVTTPPGDELMVRELTALEQISAPFELRLALISSNDSIAAEDLLGSAMVVEAELLNGATRYFHGLVNRFTQVGFEGRFVRYEAVLVPWLWLLTRSADCRIFQEMKAPDIIKQVFRDAGFSDFEESLSGSYRIWEYCVQYRESHFNFVCRLMEEEGIYYFFRHEQNKHVLVMTDTVSAHEATSGYEQIPFHPHQQVAVREQDFIESWSCTRSFRSGAYAHTDYDFVSPKSDLASSYRIDRKHAHSKLEVFDYPGEYVAAGDGERYATVRMEQLQAEYEVFQGSGPVRGIAAGALFSLTDHPQEASNREYLVISATHHIRNPAYETGAGESAGDDEGFFASSFRAIASSQTYRSPQVTPKPVVQGPQTAVVVGKSGEEIWTDKYGRIKVQFHWDRYGKSDDTSSCWIRVSQPWAGKNWGAIAIPRIGQEVVVAFLEGDPDRPLVVGSVYNGEQMPPYGLDANKTQMGIKSRSTKSGGTENFNELRFEDKKGSEDVYFHAEKDFHRVVENDDDLKVGNNQTIQVQNDRTEDVTEGNETIDIAKGNRAVTIGQGNETLDVKKGNRTTTLGMGNDAHTIKQGNRTVTLNMGNDTLTLKMGNQTTKLNLGKSTTQAMQSIELKVGANSIKVDQMGVTIKGMMVKIEGTVMAELKAPMSTVKGDGILIVKGGITLIN